MTNDELEALEKRLRHAEISEYCDPSDLCKEAADALAQLRAEVETLEHALTDANNSRETALSKVERLTRERNEALALNSVNESGANNALDLLESMKALCEVHMARAEAAERQVATLREAALFPKETATHMQRGSTYDMFGEALIQTDKPLEDMARVVIYRCKENGQLWARRYAEFYDGRFEIAALAETE